ncbi:MAG: hypothetical protein ACPHUK_07610, partial [Candidatus Poseidoniaceae archaeon]
MIRVIDCFVSSSPLSSPITNGEMLRESNKPIERHNRCQPCGRDGCEGQDSTTTEEKKLLVTYPST